MTYRAPDFVAAAARLGVEVVVGSEEAQTLAAQMGDRALVVDLDDPPAALAAIEELHRRAPVDAIVAVDDQGVVVAAEASARLGLGPLAHNPPAAVARTRDKAALRRALAAGAVPQPDFVVVGRDEAPRAPSFPCVVKPLGLAASRGVIRADDPEDLAAVAARVRGIAGDDGAPLLVDAYVPGAEVAVEGLLRAGTLEVLAIFDKPDPLEGPFFEETIYVTPSGLGRDGDIEDVTSAACAALGLVEGPVHAEVRVAPTGELAVLEVAARSIGGLCARALRFGAGISLEEVILRHALGLPIDDLRRERAASGVMMLPIRAGGVLRRVEGRDAAAAVPGVEGVEITVPAGRPVRPLPEGDRYLGFVFARGGDPATVEAALREAERRLTVVVAPES